jgi:hypothetical protein
MKEKNVALVHPHAVKFCTKIELAHRVHAQFPATARQKMQSSQFTVTQRNACLILTAEVNYKKHLMQNAMKLINPNFFSMQQVNCCAQITQFTRNAA